MATFTTLPVEIRLYIFQYLFPSDVVSSLQYLGFRNGQIDMPPPNVFITVDVSTLYQLYLSNPAGTSMGRFLKPSPLFRVSRQIREEALVVWGNVRVQVGTWLSFLAWRPRHLLASIKRFQFQYWLRGHPALADPLYLNSPQCFAATMQSWGDGLDFVTRTASPAHQPPCIDLTLTHKVFTYRLRQGLTADKLVLTKDMLGAALQDVLAGISLRGWPEKEFVLDATDELNSINDCIVPYTPLASL